MLGPTIRTECYVLTLGPNVRSMNEGKLDMFKQEMARMNINILGISERENLIQMTIVSTTMDKNPIEEME